MNFNDNNKIMPNIDSQILSDRARAEIAAKIAETGEGVNTDYVSLVVGQKPDPYVEDTGLPIGSYLVYDEIMQRVKWNSDTEIWEDFGPTFPTVSGIKVDNVEDLKETEGGVDGRVVELLGYHERGDGGGGVLYWDSSSNETPNDGTIFQVTGVTTGRWKRVVGEFLRPEWFGADNKGVNNSYEEVLNTINLSDGKLVLFDGEYDCTLSGDLILIDSDINIKGSGRIFSTSREVGGEDTFFLRLSNTYQGTIKIKGLTFDGFSWVLPRDYVDSSNDRLFSNVKITGNTIKNCNAGFWLNGKYKSVTISGNNFENLECLNGNGQHLVNAIVVGNENLSLSDQSKCIVSENIISDIYTDHSDYPWTSGILVYGEDVSIDDNIISNVGYVGVSPALVQHGAGIYVRATEYSVTNNKLRNCGQGVESGLVLKGGVKNGIVDTNHIIVDTDWEYLEKDTTSIPSGIFMNCSNTIVRGNIIKGTFRGIDNRNSGHDNNSITGNYLINIRGDDAVHLRGANTGTEVSGNWFIDMIGDKNVNSFDPVGTFNCINLRRSGNVSGFKFSGNHVIQHVVGDMISILRFVNIQPNGSGEVMRNVEIKNNYFDPGDVVHSYDLHGIQVVSSSGSSVNGLMIKDNDFSQIAFSEGENPFWLDYLAPVYNFRFEGNLGFDRDDNQLHMADNYGRMITNEGATGSVTKQLIRHDGDRNPNRVGCRFRFLKVVDEVFRFSPRDGDSIRGETADKYIELTDVGSMVEVECFENGVWDIVNSVGNYTVEV